jgi:hypothetical protein
LTSFCDAVSFTGKQMLVIGIDYYAQLAVRSPGPIMETWFLSSSRSRPPHPEQSGIVGTRAMSRAGRLADCLAVDPLDRPRRPGVPFGPFPLPVMIDGGGPMGSARDSAPDPRRGGSPLRVYIPPGRMADKIGVPLVPRARAECDRTVRLAAGILPPGCSVTTRSEIGQSCVSVKLQGGGRRRRIRANHAQSFRWDGGPSFGATLKHFGSLGGTLS